MITPLVGFLGKKIELENVETKKLKIETSEDELRNVGT